MAFIQRRLTKEPIAARSTPKTGYVTGGGIEMIRSRTNHEFSEQEVKLQVVNHYLTDEGPTVVIA